MESKEIAKKLISQHRINTDNLEVATNFVDKFTPEQREEVIKLVSTPENNDESIHQSTQPAAVATTTTAPSTEAQTSSPTLGTKAPIQHEQSKPEPVLSGTSHQAESTAEAGNENVAHPTPVVPQEPEVPKLPTPHSHETAETRGGQVRLETAAGPPATTAKEQVVQAAATTEKQTAQPERKDAIPASNPNLSHQVQPSISADEFKGESITIEPSIQQNNTNLPESRKEAPLPFSEHQQWSHQPMMNQPIYLVPINSAGMPPIGPIIMPNPGSYHPLQLPMHQTEPTMTAPTPLIRFDTTFNEEFDESNESNSYLESDLDSNQPSKSEEQQETRKLFTALLNEFKTDFLRILQECPNYRPPSQHENYHREQIDTAPGAATNTSNKPNPNMNCSSAHGGCDNEMVGAPKKDPSKPPTTGGEEHSSSGPSCTLPGLDLKMDKVQIPYFDGDLTKWISFRDQFTDLVHNNSRISPILKFSILQSHLKGLALDAINGFNLTGADYDTAWRLVTNRYNKKDQIIDEYLRKFTNLQPLETTPSGAQIITMVNSANQLMRVLPNLGLKIQDWDAWIMFQLKEKLNASLHTKWLDQAKGRQTITLDEFLEFLELQATEHSMALQKQPLHHHSTPKHTSNHHRSKQIPRPSTFLVTSDAKCV